MTSMRLETNFAAAAAHVRDLSVKINRAILRNALRSAGRVVLRKAKANLAAQGKARLGKDLMVSAKVSHTRGQARIGARKKTALGRLGHLFEKGTRPHVIRAGGRRGNTGKKVLADAARDLFFGPVVQHPGARPRPWLAPALESSQGEIAQEIRRALDAELAKAQAKGKI